MKRRLLAALAVALALGCLNTSHRTANAASTTPDFTGAWRIDLAHSEMPPRLGGPGGPGEGKPGGKGGGWSHGGGDHAGGPPPGAAHPGGMGGPGGGRQGGRFPKLLEIAMGEGTMHLSDSTGAVLQIISTDGKPPAPAPADSTTLRLTGQWKSGQLEVQRPGWRGTATDTYSLEDSGKTLVIRTKMEAKSDQHAADVKRVYHLES